ncbi:MAG: hypothetical protein AMXMBFR78_11390 [Rubrivivax sp.]|jgi:hypothetical protein
MDRKEPFDEKFIAQAFAELMSAQEQAFTVLALAVAECVGRPQKAAALERHAANAQAVMSHPMRDKLLATALQTLKLTTR